jgi:hypothetical protein
VLRGGDFVFRDGQKKKVDEFFQSLNSKKDSGIVRGVPAYYTSFDKALFSLDSLYISLGQRSFIEMLGSNEFKKEYSKTFYDDVCFAKLRLIQFLFYIYMRVSNGDTITQGGRILHFTPGRFKKVDSFKPSSSSTFKSSSSSTFKSSSSSTFKLSGISKSSSAVNRGSERGSERSVIWMLLALLCSADAQCLNTTSYVTSDQRTGEGHTLLTDIHNNLTKLQDYCDKETQEYFRSVIMPRMMIDKDVNKLGLNPTILCSILKRMLHIDGDETVTEDKELSAAAAAAVGMEE